MKALVERELLSIIETLKEIQTILLGHQIKIFTDHDDLIHPNFGRILGHEEQIKGTLNEEVSTYIWGAQGKMRQFGLHC